VVHTGRNWATAGACLAGQVAALVLVQQLDADSTALLRWLTCSTARCAKHTSTQVRASQARQKKNLSRTHHALAGGGQGGRQSRYAPSSSFRADVESAAAPAPEADDTVLARDVPSMTPRTWSTTDERGTIASSRLPPITRTCGGEMQDTRTQPTHTRTCTHTHTHTHTHTQRALASLARQQQRRVRVSATGSP
jgi:hypothetical protein